MRKGRPPVLAYGPFLCLLLASCGESTTPSARDSEQLDNAGQMLDTASDELSNIDTGELEEPYAIEASPAPAD